MWDGLADFVIKVISQTGVPGAIAAAVLVGLGLVVVLVAKGAGLYDGSRTERQKTDFQDKLIAQVDALAKREADIRADLVKAEAENDAIKERARALQTSVDLMRLQLRRAIDLLKAVREGRLPPSAIDDFDVAEPPCQ